MKSFAERLEFFCHLLTAALPYRLDRALYVFRQFVARINGYGRFGVPVANRHAKSRRARARGDDRQEYFYDVEIDHSGGARPIRTLAGYFHISLAVQRLNLHESIHAGSLK